MAVFFDFFLPCFLPASNFFYFFANFFVFLLKKTGFWQKRHRVFLFFSLLILQDIFKK